MLSYKTPAAIKRENAEASLHMTASNPNPKPQHDAVKGARTEGLAEAHSAALDRRNHG